MQNSGVQRIQSTFGTTKVFFPVIHLPDDGKHGMTAVAVALEAGADGVFLINQGTSTRNIVDNLIPQIRKEFGHETWIGINSLGSTVEEVILMSAKLPETRIDGIWSDDAGVDSLREDSFLAARSALHAVREATGWGGLYFGGTAFKTQTQIPEDMLGVVARRAASFIDVVTTSGPGTGRKADPNKVRLMREGIPEAAIGLASGVTPENVSQFLPYIDAFLVASGIERSFGVLDAARTRALAEIIHGFQCPPIESRNAPSLRTPKAAVDNWNAMSCTYANPGSSRVFDHNANDKHMLLTPFAQPSWEPRFALDCRWLRIETITQCLDLFLGPLTYRKANPTFDIFETSKNRLALRLHGGWVAGIHGPKLAENACKGMAAELVYQWLLKDAEYPLQPWFDGGEDKGFQAFDVPYNAYPFELYDFMIVEPKWFECHK